VLLSNINFLIFAVLVVWSIATVVFIQTILNCEVFNNNTNNSMFGEASAESRRHILCSSKVNWKINLLEVDGSTHVQATSQSMSNSPIQQLRQCSALRLQIYHRPQTHWCLFLRCCSLASGGTSVKVALLPAVCHGCTCSWLAEYGCQLTECRESTTIIYHLQWFHASMLCCCYKVQLMDSEVGLRVQQLQQAFFQCNYAVIVLKRVHILYKVIYI